MVILRSAALFVVAAFFEIGGAWLVWQGVREHRGWVWVAGGILSLGDNPPARPLEPRRTAHLVVDLQNGFMEEGAPFELPVARAIVPAVKPPAATL